MTTSAACGSHSSIPLLLLTTKSSKPQPFECFAVDLKFERPLPWYHTQSSYNASERASGAADEGHREKVVLFLIN